jgi:hypothetical protein
MGVEEVLSLLTRVVALLGETSIEKQGPHCVPAIRMIPISEGQKLRRQADLADERDQLIEDARSCLKRLSAWLLGRRIVIDDEDPIRVPNGGGEL